MARMIKISGSLMGIYKHNLREFENECPSNQDVDSTRSDQNYHLISRGETAKEIEQYRKQVMAEVFHYNRKNVVNGIEYVVSLPADATNEKQFYEETVNYIASTLSLGERAILQAVVHKDELQGVGSSSHLHVLAIPCTFNNIQEGSREGYQHKLCANELTKRAQMKNWHPNYQAWLSEHGVEGSVHTGATGGKNISVQALKELTKTTGLTIDQIKDLDKENQVLKEQLFEKDKQLEVANQQIKKLTEKEVSHQWGSMEWGTQEWGHTMEGDRLW